MKKLKNLDKFLLFFMIVYPLFGVIMIFSASSASTVLWYHVASNHFVIRQILSIIIGYIIGIVVLSFPTNRYKTIIYPGIIGIIALLIYVLVNGKVNHNAQSWIEIWKFSLQPAEFAKTALIIFMAVFYNNLYIKKETKIGKYIIPLIIVGLCVILTALQPDYGTAIIIVFICGFSFLSVPFVKAHFKEFARIALVGIALFAIVCSIFSSKIFTTERMSRLDFLNPCENEKATSQVCNGLIAISNGGLLGRGLGNSTQKYMYLPESHTDFIFPIICEELGSLVGIIVIVGYGLLLYRLWKIAKRSENLRLSIICYGTFWYFTMHILINLLGVLALIPLTGVTLPFLSYGGSFTINAIVLLCCCQRCSLESKELRVKRHLANI